MSNPSRAITSSNTSGYSADYSDPRSPTMDDGKLSEKPCDIAEMVAQGIRAAMPGIVAQLKRAVTHGIRQTNDEVRSGASTSKNRNGKRNRKNQSGSQRGYPNKKRGNYLGPYPKCDKCNFHHKGECPTCSNCGRKGHYVKYCRKGPKEGGDPEKEARESYSTMQATWILPKVEPSG